MDAILDDEIEPLIHAESVKAMANLQSATDTAALYLLVLGLLGLYFAIAAAWLMYRSISGPVRALVHGTVIVGGGDLEHMIDTGSRDEFGDLAAAFNRMVEHLARALWSVEDGRAQLERRVEERSVELEREITERKRAEERLLASEDGLKKRVADLEEARRELEEQGTNLVGLAGDLRVARDDARAANRAKSEFLAAMSHELRTPLNAVIGFSEIIRDETFGPVGSVQYRNYASDFHESGQHLLALINDILDLSKIESGTDELHEDEIDIAEITRAALKLVRQRAEQGGIKLALELQDRLPALRADQRKLKQILVNLLSNAVKFTDAGGEVTLRTWCRMDSGYVFQVVDTGIGIAPEDIPRALVQYGQVDGDLNRQYEGTGLGLPLTKALVEQHGGTLDFQSEVGVGTTVTARFPAKRIVASPDNVQLLDVADQAVG